MNSPLGVVASPQVVPPLKVAVLGASPNTPSTSVTLADCAVAALQRRYEIDVTRVDVYHLGPGLTSAVTRADADADAEKAFEAVEDSDLLVVSVPTYRGSYPGMFKHFMDIVRQRPFDRKPVLLMTTGGSSRHMLMIDHVLRPLFVFLHAYTAPTSVFATSADFEGDRVLDPEIPQRIDRALDDLAPLLPVRKDINTEDARTKATQGTREPAEAFAGGHHCRHGSGDCSSHR